MSLLYQIPRNALWWLLIAQAGVILPHSEHLPTWLLAVWALAVTWRVQIVRGAWTAPASAFKTVLALGSVVSLVLSYGQLFALEPLVALLVLAFVLKLLELNRQRDVLLLLLLGFFVASTQLLFSTSILAFAYTILCCWLLITALMALHTASRGHSLWASLRRSGVYMLQALPLALLLFFVMPRIGSLWTVPLSESSGKTGFSDFMSPGNISQLNKDYSPAFRVTFNNAQKPANRDLYWRGMSLPNYDGRSWQLSTVDRNSQLSYRRIQQQRRQYPPAWEAELGRYAGSPDQRYYDYQVMMEPSFQPWLFGLLTPVSGQSDVLLTDDFSLLRAKPVSQRFRYRLRSFPEFPRKNSGLKRSERYLNTQIPKGFNPQTQALAQSWSEQYSDQQLIAQLLRLFNQEFSYSLENLDVAGQHGIDEFLFTNRRGYCEHFAGSFVFFLRAAGIPARVVVGYQGGQWNEQEQYLLVTQADAHAWAEVWLPGRGWQRFDPTGAVAPERIERGFREYIEQATEAGSQGISQYRQAPWLSQLQLRLDALNYSWQNWVLSYDQEQQLQLFQKVLGGTDQWRVGLALISGAGIILGVLALLLWWRGRPKPPPIDIRPWLQLEKKLAKLGVSREAGETPEQFTQRVAQKQPSLQPLLAKYTQLSYRLMYQTTGSDEQKLQLQRQLRQLLLSIKIP